MDQAATLRQIAAHHGRPSSPVRVIAVTSGKGGVGKTHVVANLAYAFARLKRRVLVLDADLGLGNLDVLLGLTPRHTLQHVLSGEKRLREIVVEGPGGMQILPASSGVQELTALTEGQRLCLLTELGEMEEWVDVLLIDTGAGISSNVLYFNLAAQEILVVVSPEPTSLTDAYALMKILSTRHAERHFLLLVNGAEGAEEGREVYERLSAATDRFLDVSINYVGHVPRDESVPRAVRGQRIVLEAYPQSHAGRAFMALARALLKENPPEQPKGNIQFFWGRILGGLTRGTP